MKVTLGGDRLGSGNKNKIALRNYERSTFNLTQTFTSSMQVGTLIPFLVIPAMRGDTFEIDLTADGRTIPTKGPLFGSFKLQYDVFQCPVRLYQAILHNNPTAIGLNMQNVKFPTIRTQALCNMSGKKDPGKFKNNCLLKYLGISGLGSRAISGNSIITRDFNALPVLAYYDIFKNYYANKQETFAYFITGGSENKTERATTLKFESGNSVSPNSTTIIDTGYYGNAYFNITDWERKENEDLNITAQNLLASIKIKMIPDEGTAITKTINEWRIWDMEAFPYSSNILFEFVKYEITSNNALRIFTKFNINDLKTKRESLDNDSWEHFEYSYEKQYFKDANLIIDKFALKNIDDMRMKLLSHNNLGTPFTIINDNNDAPGTWDNTSGDGSGMPYASLTGVTHINNSKNSVYPLNGIMLKTYQSDLFNNWLRTEWIDGDNGISAITAVSTSDGSFTMDALTLAEKLYNMLNRVAVSDGTYEGWQDAVYTQSPKRHIESPVYLGGMSSEIMFEEIVQTAPADGEPLGTLAGKGKILKRKGGKIVVKCDEASFIIGIVSITPRINYTQGNEWYMTDLFSMDDFHKPALDGIGFQNLMQEQMFYGATIIGDDGQPSYRYTAGKVPAWINYMTAVDKAYGDFAETEGNGFMVLQRNYEHNSPNGSISDMTTYIDPRKYNYAFAYTDLEAQNFWIQIHSEIKARRLMSAKQIPSI